MTSFISKGPRFFNYVHSAAQCSLRTIIKVAATRLLKGLYDIYGTSRFMRVLTTKITLYSSIF
jgi:hypothetical protein